MGRCCTATSAGNVQPSLLGKLLNVLCSVLRSLVILAHLVRESCIRIDADCASQSLQLLNERSKILCTKRAVKSKAHYRIVRKGCIKSIQLVSAKYSSALVVHSSRYHNREISSGNVLNCIKGSLGIECIIYCLNQKKVYSALNQSLNLLHISLCHLLKCNIPALRGINIRRKGKRFYSRAHTSSNKHPAAGSICHLAGNLCTLEVYLPHSALHAVILLRNCISAESVCLYNVSSSLYILLVDSFNHILSGEVKDIIVPLTSQKIAGKKIIPLNTGTHSTVQDEDFPPHHLHYITL